VSGVEDVSNMVKGKKRISLIEEVLNVEETKLATGHQQTVNRLLKHLNGKVHFDFKRKLYKINQQTGNQKLATGD
jgi:hypothetical protein